VDGGGTALRHSAERLLGLLQGRGETLACAESLTGGLIAATLTEVPGASAVFNGAIVSYSTPSKHDLLGVDAALLRDHGAVHAEVAEAMAAGCARALHADWAVAVTGVAGPTPQDGQEVGTVFVAVHGPHGRIRTRRLAIPGNRGMIRRRTGMEALALLIEAVGGKARAGEGMPDAGK
jgi:nicotinamide-nucleotide amidase